MTYRLSADLRESFLRLPDSRFELSPVTRHLFSNRPKKFVRLGVLSGASPARKPFLPTIDAKCVGYTFHFRNSNVEDRVQGSRRSVPAPNAPASGGGGGTLPGPNNSWPDEKNGFLYSVAQEMLTQGGRNLQDRRRQLCPRLRKGHSQRRLVFLSWFCLSCVPRNACDLD